MNEVWPTVRLGDLLTDIQPGFASGKHNSEGVGIPHFRPMNVSTDGRIERTVTKYVDPAAGRADLRLKRDDIVFNNTNSPELVGKTALFQDTDFPAYSNHMTRLRVDETRIDSRFAAMRLHQAWREGWFAAHCNNHVSQASIGRDVLKAFEIELPPLDIQREITSLVVESENRKSSALGHLTASLNSLAGFRRSVLAAACSGRLTADWRATAEINESTIELVYKARMSLNPINRQIENLDPPAIPDWLEVPDTWSWTPLGELADIRSGIQKQPKRAPKHNSYPYLRVANVYRGRLDLREIQQFELFGNELDTYRLQRGDLLVVEGNGSASEIGRSAIWRGEIENCVHQNHIIRVRLTAMEPQFVDLFWNSPTGAREIAELAVTSSGLYSLSTKKIASVTVPVPPVEEQREIVRRVYGLMEIADRLQASIEMANQHITDSTQAILAKALRGQLSTIDRHTHHQLSRTGL